MKKYFVVLYVFVLVNTIEAQRSLSINWEKNYGGSSDEYLHHTSKSHGSGYIMLGDTYSSDIDVTGNNGQSDCWLVKTSETGAIEWQKNYGSMGDDYGSQIQATNDGGYIFVGTASNATGDVTAHHGGYGDVWVVKIDANGNIDWQKCYGGTEYDMGINISQTSTGNFIIGASTSSTDGDVASPAPGGYGDFWVFMIDNLGNIMWEKAIGSPEFDILMDLEITSSGGCVVSGVVGGSGGHVTNYYGQDDAWVVKLDATGNIVWENTFGGTQRDEGNAISVLPTGDLILAFTSSSSDGTMSSNNGDGDMWIAKLSSTTLTLDWAQSFGGSLPEEARSILVQSDGIVIAGSTSSSNGDVSSNHGQVDGWVIKVDNSGALVWDKSFGGSLNDYVSDVIELSGNNFAIASSTQSNDFDISQNNGQHDFWLANIDINSSNSEPFKKAEDILLYPNPVNDKLFVQGENILFVELLSYNGSLIHHVSCQNQNNVMVHLPKCKDGYYFIKIATKDKTYFKKIQLKTY